MGENFARQNNLNMKGGFYGVRETAWGHLRENRDPQWGEIISEGPLDFWACLMFGDIISNFYVP